MTAFKSDFLNVLQGRGFIHQISDPDSLDALAGRGELVGYIGFDCTAPSLHVGSMVQIMCLYWLQQTGNKPIALMGGGTTRVGDPSGKDETRKILSIEDIERNKEGIKQVFSQFLKFGEGKHDAVMPDNAEWLTKLNWIEMLRDIGRHFSVNRMLAMDSVKLRLERDQEMSFIEFNYMILQAYDYAVLNQRYDCRLQMGGSDQWGNIVNGIDLGRRMGTPQLHALTTPLITTSSGEKMGKTASCTARTRPTRRRKPHGKPLRKAGSRKTFRVSKFPAPNSKPAAACWGCSSRPASSPPTARRVVKSRAAVFASTTLP